MRIWKYRGRALAECDVWGRRSNRGPSPDSLTRHLDSSLLDGPGDEERMHAEVPPDSSQGQTIGQ
jgi:hypothetical protein